MGDVINLGRARKARRRAAAEAQAAANRAAFGRTKSDKIATRAERERSDNRLDQAKRED